MEFFIVASGLISNPQNTDRKKGEILFWGFQRPPNTSDVSGLKNACMLLNELGLRNGTGAKQGSWFLSEGCGEDRVHTEVIVISPVQNKGIPNLFHSQHVEGKVQIP